MRDHLGALACETPARILALVVGLAERRDDGDDDVVVPLVALHLRSGRTIQGWLLALDERARNGATLLVHTASGDPAQPKPDVTYLDVASVEAVTIFSADQVVPWLPGGHQRPVRTEPPPGRLVLARCAQDVAQALSAQTAWAGEVDVQDVSTAEPEALFRLRQVIRNVQSVLEELLRDGMAKQAFCERVTRLAFGAGSSASIKLSDATLTFITSAEPGARMGKRALRSAIAAVL